VGSPRDDGESLPELVFLAAVPFVGGRMHPLAAAYRLAALPVVRDMLAVGRFRMTELLERISTRALGANELIGADPELASLRNVNSPDEYEAAVRASRPSDG
jgi:molybdopterin-guanine dinucleotide biosynthesis protein A